MFPKVLSLKIKVIKMDHNVDIYSVVAKTINTSTRIYSSKASFKTTHEFMSSILLMYVMLSMK